MTIPCAGWMRFENSHASASNYSDLVTSLSRHPRIRGRLIVPNKIRYFTFRLNHNSCRECVLCRMQDDEESDV